jgi:hypothetical protein
MRPETSAGQLLIRERRRETGRSAARPSILASVTEILHWTNF